MKSKKIKSYAQFFISKFPKKFYNINKVDFFYKKYFYTDACRVKKLFGMHHGSIK